MGIKLFNMFDVAVVGAGPAGLHLAKLCEKMGYKTCLFEEHERIGVPLSCSGLISSNIEGFFPGISGWEAVENRVSRAVLHSRRSTFSLGKPGAAYVVDRTKFDQKLRSFLDSEVKLSCRVSSVREGEECMILKTDRGDFRAEMVVGSDGPLSIVGSGMVKKDIFRGLIAVTCREGRGENVDLYFRPSMSKDGFLWRIPRGDRTEFGIMGKSVDFRMLERFFGIKKYKKYAGLIPVYVSGKTYGRRRLLVGDAAGQVKPWSGGGVVYGLTCAEMAAKAIEKAFRLNDFGEGMLAGYERGWKKRIGKQILAGRVLRKLMGLSTDMELDMLFRIAGRFDYRKLDMDFIV